MPEQPKSFTARFLFWLAHSIFNHRRWFAWPQLFLVIASIFYTVYHLEFLTSRDALVGGSKQYHLDYLKFREEFPIRDDFVVLVESESLEKNRQFVERLGAKLEADTNTFANVFYKADLSKMGPKALLFLPEDALADLSKTLREYQPMLSQFSKVTNMVSLFSLVNTMVRTAKREATPETDALVKSLPALERIVAQALDGLQRPGHPPSPGVTSFFEGGAEAESQMYLTFASNRIFMVTAQPRTDDLVSDAIERIRQLISETSTEVPGLNVGLTGETVLEQDEMAQSQSDTTRATILSLFLVALIFIYGYHETGRPLKATLCLLVGLGYTMGFTTLAVGHLNILTITFVPMLVGLAIDFGVHLISRYEEELWRGHTELFALEKGIVFTGMGIFTGAFTTAGAFFAMVFTNFKGIQEMGVICGGGLLVCLVPMMTLLPVLLLRGRQNVLDHQLGPALGVKATHEVDRRARIEHIWLDRPITMIAITVVLSVLAGFATRNVKFDYNLINMQSKGLPSVYYENKLLASTDRPLLYGVSVATNLSEATNRIIAFTNLPSVSMIESVVPYLTENQTKKLQLVSELKKVVSGIQFEPVDMHPVDTKALYLSLYALHGYMGLAADQAQEDPAIQKQLLSLRHTLDRLIKLERILPAQVVSEKLTDFQQALFTDLRRTFDALRNQDDSGPLRAQDLPGFMRERFVGRTGQFLLQIYPRKDVWQHEYQKEFVQQIQSVDPAATGTPVQLFNYTAILKNSYQEAANYSLIAIAILVFIHFRSVTCVILSLLPVGFGFLWMLGIMGYFDIPFNPANIMTLPLIVGIGVTNGIHILNRFAEEQHPSILARSTGKAVLVSGLTTIAGFGSLILAEHRGIRSLGIIMSVGVATCMIVGLTFLPALLNLLAKYGWQIKKTQRDNAQSTLGREEPR
jgi:uncharacterized protein